MWVSDLRVGPNMDQWCLYGLNERPTVNFQEIKQQKITNISFAAKASPRKPFRCFRRSARCTRGGGLQTKDQLGTHGGNNLLKHFEAQASPVTAFACVRMVPHRWINHLCWRERTGSPSISFWAQQRLPVGDTSWRLKAQTVISLSSRRSRRSSVVP